MATSTPKTGHASILKVDTSGGGSVQTILNQTTATLTGNFDLVETTSKSGDTWKEYIPANKDFTVSLDCYIDSSNGGDTTGLEVLKTAAFAGNILDFVFTEDHDTTDMTYTFSGYVSNLSSNYEDAGVQSWTASIQSSGTVTPA